MRNLLPFSQVAPKVIEIEITMYQEILDTLLYFYTDGSQLEPDLDIAHRIQDICSVYQVEHGNIGSR